MPKRKAEKSVATESEYERLKRMDAPRERFQRYAAGIEERTIREYGYYVNALRYSRS